MKKIVLPVLIVAIAGFFTYNYIMAAPKEIATATPDVEINAVSLAKEFTTSEQVATEKYGEKVIEVKGIITAVDGKSITLDNKVNCVFKENVSVNIGETIKIKGLFIGYDEMFNEIKIDQSSIIQ